MNIDFVRSRIETTIMVDTTNEIVNALDTVLVNHTSLLIALTGILVILYQTQVNWNNISSTFTQIITMILVTMISSDIQAMFPDLHNVYQLANYTSIAISIVAMVKSVPEPLEQTLLIHRLRYTFIYSTAKNYVQFFSGKTAALVVTIVCITILLLKSKHVFNGEHSIVPGAITEKPKLPVIVRAILSVWRIFVLDFTINMLFMQDLPGGVQNLLYIIGVLVLIGFIVTVIPDGDWRSFALWRVGDLFMRNLGNTLKLDNTCLALIVSSVYIVSVTISQIIYTQNKKREGNLYMELLRFVVSSTITRALLSMTDHLPTIDLVMIRFLIVLFFFL